MASKKRVKQTTGGVGVVDAPQDPGTPEGSTTPAAPPLTYQYKEGDNLRLDPKVIRVSQKDNVRYSLKRPRLDRLKKQIVEEGGIITPVQVVEIPKEQRDGTGHEFDLVAGFYRTTAAKELNDSSNAGLTVPAVVRVFPDRLSRVRSQVQENVEREDLTPMDTAVAIRQLLDEGASRSQIANMFPRNVGKGSITLQPASNAWINMMVSFLDFPQKIRSRIQDGRIGIAGAYALSKKPADKWDEIADKIEENRIKEQDQYIKDEETFLAAEKKSEEQRQKDEEAAKKEADIRQAVDTARADVLNLEKLQKEAALEATNAFKAKVDPSTIRDKEAVKLAEEKFRAAKQHEDACRENLSKAQRTFDNAKAKLDALEKRAKGAAETEKGDRPVSPNGQTGQTSTPTTTQVPRSAGRGKSGSAGPADVDRAAREVGVQVQVTPLKTVKEVREVIDGLKYLSTARDKQPQTQALHGLLTQVLDGTLDDAHFYQEVLNLMGEK